MTILDRILGRQQRGNIESPKVPISSKNILEYFGITSGGSEISVTPEKILGLPPVWCAVNFMSRSLASLPLHPYEKSDNGPKRLQTPLAAILNSAANDEMSAYAVRKWFWERVFTTGRGLLLIERDGRGQVRDLFPMEPAKTTIERKNGARLYRYKSDAGDVVYPASDVIDVAYMLREDGLKHYGPLATCASRLSTALGAERYGSKIFKNGGLPAVALEGPFESVEGANNAAQNIADVAADAFNKGRPAISLPAGHKLTAIGIDPQKMQMVEFQRFLIEEVARVFQLPPIFLHELTRGTFSNAEQQDLHFVKHVITGWATAFEGEANLKIFGRANASKANAKYIVHNVDGLLRGDFEKRMAGLAQGVQNAILTPNEARALENRPSMPKGDELLIQGATVPLGSQPAPAAPGETPAA